MKRDSVDQEKVLSLAKKYVTDTHIGSLEKYNLEKIIKAEWFDKANEEIKADIQVRVTTVVPTIGDPPINFYNETIIIGGNYFTVRKHKLAQTGILQNNYPEWMK